MTSSSADCTLAGARLISSASRKLVNTGPSSTSKPPPPGLSTRVPTRSAGTRSGVNWMRLNVPPRTWASVRTVSVLARPGTPSRSTWPPASSETSRRSSIASWPTMTRLISCSASSSAPRGISRWVGSSCSFMSPRCRGRREGSDQAAEPDQGERGAEQQQGEAPAGEARGDLVLAVLAPELRAELLVDLAEAIGVRGGEGLAAGGARDLLQRLRGGRHAPGDGATARALDGDRPLAGAEGDGVDADVRLARGLRGDHRVD